MPVFVYSVGFDARVLLTGATWCTAAGHGAALDDGFDAGTSMYTGVASWSWITPADTAVDLRLSRWSSCGGVGSSEAQGDDLWGLD